MNQNKKFMLAAVLLALLLTVAVSGTLAYLTDATSEVKNIFTPADVTVEIVEEFDNNVKENVIIKNTGKASAYIRAAIVVTWQDSNGNVYGKMPEASDYTMTIGSGWTKDADGFYYYDSAVAVGGVTNPLIVKCTQNKQCEDSDYTLNVEIVVQGIQSEGMGATSASDAFSKAAGN